MIVLCELVYNLFYKFSYLQKKEHLQEVVDEFTLIINTDSYESENSKK